MSATYEQILSTFTQKQMFNRWSAGKVFSIESPVQSGESLHQHNYYQFWYVERGSCTHTIEGKEHTMYAGDAFILPPDLTHMTTLADDTRIYCCEFSLSEVLSGAENAYFKKLSEITQGVSFEILFANELYGAREKFSFTLETQKRIEGVFERLLEEYEEEKLLFEDFLQLLVMELLLLFIREYARNPRHTSEHNSYDTYRGIIKEAVHYIDQNYDKALTLDEMCRRFALSKTYFCYLFKLDTHKTFIEYLQERRIENAVQLLIGSSQSVTDISQTVGFQDPSHFSRTFKKLKGMSPSDYRKYRRAG